MSTEWVSRIEIVSRLVKSKTDLQTYIKHLKKHILLLNKCLKHKLGCVKNFSRIESNLSILKTYLEKFKNKLNLKKYSRRELLWQNVESCFNRRISTGNIVNLKIKDPKLFFQKAFRSFSIQIRKQLKRSLLKVNVVLCYFH